MAEQLTKGVDTLEAVSWSGSGLATAGDFEVSVIFQTITGGLNQNSVRVESLSFIGGAEGTVGGGENGPLIIGGDNSADAFVRNRAAVRLYIQAGGTNSKVENLDLGHPRQYTVCQGGEFEDITMDSGYLFVNADTTSDNLYFAGGESHHKYNSTDYTEFVAVGGTHTLERVANLLVVGPGAVVIIDTPAGTAWTGAVIWNFGTIILKSGSIPGIKGYGGVFDTSQARGTITGLGSDSWINFAMRIVPSPYVSTANATSPGALGREIGDAIPIS